MGELKRILCVGSGDEGAEEIARLRELAEGMSDFELWFVGAVEIPELNASRTKVLAPPKLFRRRWLLGMYVFISLPLVVVAQCVRARPQAVVTFTTGAALAAFLGSLLVRSPLSLFLSSLPWLTGARKRHWVWKQGVLYFRDCLAMLAAERVIVPTELMKQAIVEEVPFIRQYVSVLPYSVPTAGAPGSIEQRLERKMTTISTYNFPDPAFIILTQLELDAREPLESLLHAVAAVDDDSLCVLILGSGKERVTLASIAAGLGMPDRIVFLPDESLAPEAYAGFDLVLLLQERGMSLPMLNALGAKVPVLGTLSGSLPEVLGSSPLLLVPNDTEALVQRLKSLLNSRDALRQTRELSEAAAKNYSFAWSARALEMSVRSG